MGNETITISIFRFRDNIQFVFFLAIACLAILTTAFCQTAAAQGGKYSELVVADKYDLQLAPFDASEEQQAAIRKQNRQATRNISEASKQVDEILEGGGNIGAPIIAEFFDGYVFPSMTLTDKRVISSLGSKRTKFLKDYLNAKVTGGVRTGMINITINAMQKICANDALHPAARLNAVYLLGILDQTPAVRLKNQLPVPSQAAFSSLRKIFESSRDQRSFPVYLKVAALAGIQRHIEIDRLTGGSLISKDEKTALLTDIDAILKDEQTGDLAYWLKRRGMQVVGLIGRPESIDTALSMLNSKDAGLWLQFDALEAIGKLNLRSNSAEKNTEVAVAVAGFLARSFENESKSIEQSVTKLVFDNMLFGDIDLAETGTNYSDDPAVTPSGGFEKVMGDEPGFRQFDGFNNDRFGEKPAVKIDLPGFKLNVIRRRIKSLAFTGAQVLGGVDGRQGLSQLADADGQALITKTIQLLNQTLEASNVGIIDLEAKAEAQSFGAKEEQRSVTKQLVDICADTGKKLGSYVRTQTGEPEPTGTAPDAGSPGEENGLPKF